jgi:hypothetical protein
LKGYIFVNHVMWFIWVTFYCRSLHDTCNMSYCEYFIWIYDQGHPQPWEDTLWMLPQRFIFLVFLYKRPNHRLLSIQIIVWFHFCIKTALERAVEFAKMQDLQTYSTDCCTRVMNEKLVMILSYHEVVISCFYFSLFIV